MFAIVSASSLLGMRTPARFLGLLAAIFLLLSASFARADLRTDGKWKQGPLREEYKVQQWLDACGPKPQSMTTGGGELVEVRIEGDELAFVGGGRVYRSNQCYDPMPTLSRETHTRAANGKSWTTRCTTPPSDPRKAMLNTLVSATSDTQIDITETGRYEITLENGRCIADVNRTRSFTFATDSGAAQAPTATPPSTTKPAANVNRTRSFTFATDSGAAQAPTATPPSTTKPAEPPKASACTSPGEPQKLEVRPSKKLLRTGETFQFRALVLDAKGCTTQTATTWKLAPEAAGKGVSVDGGGRVTIAKDAAEGSVEIIATAAGKDTHVTVEVTSPARYDELLASSGLNAAGENDEAASVVIASQSLGAGEGRVEDRSRQRRMLFLAIIGGVLLVLGALSVLLLRRARRAKALLAEADQRHEARVKQALDERHKRETEHAAQQRAHEESVAAARFAAERQAAAAMVCPKCGREEAAGTSFCPHDGTPLMPASTASPGGTCPVCGRAFGPNVTVCPQHKEELVPQPASAPAPVAATPVKRGKICPTCGERFQKEAEFCGKDGTVLVLIN